MNNNIEQEIKLLKAESERRGNGCTALHVGAAYTETTHTISYEAMHTLLAEGANPNAQDSAGNTPLHLTNSSWFIRELHRAGKLIPDICNIQGETALHLAQDGGIVAELLHTAGFSANVQDKAGYTPLMRFIERFIGYTPDEYDFKTSLTVNEIIEHQNCPHAWFGIVNLITKTSSAFLLAQSSAGDTALSLAGKLHPRLAERVIEHLNTAIKQ